VEGKTVEALEKCGIAGVLQRMFTGNYEQSLVYYQIVAQLVMKTPEREDMEGLLTNVFGNIHRVTECNLTDLMELLE